MHTPAFVSSFCGTSVQNARTSAGAFATPRCAMASDSVAPKIVINKTNFEPHNVVSVVYEPVYPSLSVAESIASNSALLATLKKKRPATLPSSSTTTPTTSPFTSSSSPADVYYPSSVRNQAPFITFGADNSLSVAYEIVEAEVAGVSSTASVPFWEAKTYKWASSSSTSEADEEEFETIDTTLFEKYFPSDVRNRAPYINIVHGGYRKDSLTVGSEFVKFNPKLSSMLELPTLGKGEVDQPSTELNMLLNGAATIAKFFPDARLNKAPKIVIVPDESVTFSMEDVSVTDEEAAEVAGNYDKTA